MREWTDEQTGRRIRRLTATPKGAHLSYFRNPKHLPDGRVLAYHGEHGLVAIEPESGMVERMAVSPGWTARLRESDGRLWHTDASHREVWAADLPTGRPKLLAMLPADAPGLLRDITCDGRTALLVDSRQDLKRYGYPADNKLEAVWRYFNRPRSSNLFAVDLASGAVTLLAETDGVCIDHVDASPTDPGLVRFCHDAVSERHQRIWTVRTDGSQLRKIRPQREGETVMHEFWWPGGELIGYKVQDRAGDPTFHSIPWGEYAPRPTLFGLADLEGREVYLSNPLNHWHSHVYRSPDGRWLCGEGTDGHSFVFAARFSQDDPAVDFVPLGTIHTAYSAFRGQNVNAAFSADARWVLYNDTFDGVAQVCAVSNQ